MVRKRDARNIDGIILVNKPKGDSSNRTLQRVRHLFEAKKAGHTGNLDPMATGVLPICLGEATKFSQYMLDADKAYQATIVLGQQTTTGDAEGELLEEKDSSHITQTQIEATLPQFLGEIQQVPPMYSALKVDGQPLYKLARQGITVERKARAVTIQQLILDAFRPSAKAELDITVYCSKGTYIRTLAEDIAKALGDLGGHLSRLHRIQAGQFLQQQCITLEKLEQIKQQQGLAALDLLLIPIQQAVNQLPMVEVNAKAGYHMQLGQAVMLANSPQQGMVAIRQEDGLFLGVGEINDGKLQPRRLVVR